MARRGAPQSQPHASRISGGDIILRADAGELPGGEASFSFLGTWHTVGHLPGQIAIPPTPASLPVSCGDSSCPWSQARQEKGGGVRAVSDSDKSLGASGAGGIQVAGRRRRQPRPAQFAQDSGVPRPRDTVNVLTSHPDDQRR